MVKRLTSEIRIGFKVPEEFLKGWKQQTNKQMFNRTYNRDVPGKARVQGGTKGWDPHCV